MMIRHALPFTIIPLLGSLLVVGCARSEEAAFTSIGNENGQAAVATARAGEGEDDEVALGEWRAGLQEDQSTIEFGPRGATPLLSLRCDSRRGTMLQRLGVAPAGDLPVMLVTVGSETKRLAVTSAGGTLPMLRATLPVSDPFRAVLSGATTPIIIRIGDSPPLVLPPNAMVGTYVSECANGENQMGARAGASAPPAEGNQAAANTAAPLAD
jgi:hypothetical protein